MTGRERASKEALAEAMEREAILELENKVITQSALFRSGSFGPGELPPWAGAARSHPDAQFLAGDDPRLPPMPAKPKLLDYFTYRFGPSQHLLQSARLARQNGCDEKIVLACLLHDISVVGFILPDHGYWGAQLVEPYVDEEVSWAIRYHQALRYYPDTANGYDYPETYVKWFGEDYQPDPYIERDYACALKHKWYMSARHITINDLYSFDPNVQVSIDEFVDLIGRHFRQPEEGLGMDGSPSAHMWRTIIRPTKFL
jgi:hypothetical protein